MSPTLLDILTELARTLEAGLLLAGQPDATLPLQDWHTLATALRLEVEGALGQGTGRRDVRRRLRLLDSKGLEVGRGGKGK